jgi:hypothetical protein
MSKLEQLTPNAAVRGILPDGLVTVVNVQWFGSEALELTYKSPNGKVANELLYRHDDARIEVVELGRPCRSDATRSSISHSQVGEHPGKHQHQRPEQRLGHHLPE